MGPVWWRWIREVKALASKPLSKYARQWRGHPRPGPVGVFDCGSEPCAKKEARMKYCSVKGSHLNPLHPLASAGSIEPQVAFFAPT